MGVDPGAPQKIVKMYTYSAGDNPALRADYLTIALRAVAEALLPYVRRGAPFVVCPQQPSDDAHPGPTNVLREITVEAGVIPLDANASMWKEIGRFPRELATGEVIAATHAAGKKVGTRNERQRLLDLIAEAADAGPEARGALDWIAEQMKET